MPEQSQYRRYRGSLISLLAGGLMLLNLPVQADFRIPGYELVYNAPRETTLQNSDLRNAAVVWQQMFDAAHSHIDLAQFYVANEKGSLLDGVLAHLRQAGERGVKIRFLMEEKGVGISTPETLAALKTIPNLELRTIPFHRLTGGIVHAKYLLVDGQQAFVGSQNFDWRALEQIQETGLLISDEPTVKQIQAIFDQDWRAQALLAESKPVPKLEWQAPASVPQGNYLVASPRDYNPSGVIDSQTELPRLLANAKSRIRVQVMDYAPLSWGEHGNRAFYAPIDNALRSAAARGVKIELMVSNWNLKKPDVFWLKSLSLVPNVQLKVVTIPQASRGFIPYARVVHSKIMTIDGTVAWIGTSNWSGGYLDNSRNLELVLNSVPMTARVDALFSQLWNSQYAQPVRVDYDYPVPHPGRQE
ncbi:phospholipase D-like domain-containing protein [Tatumella sp. UBA2305]|uniref:phospholipase D-like domain-containing protein n=1 Tax=Tatumella sp. UBA2305 TaxID=1947647 RepID=UPI0025F18E3A|nr:phospholipase D-like domain-containing protein [Tatumella sp. UBA2305]